MQTGQLWHTVCTAQLSKLLCRIWSVTDIRMHLQRLLPVGCLYFRSACCLVYTQEPAQGISFIQHLPWCVLHRRPNSLPEVTWHTI